MLSSHRQFGIVCATGITLSVVVLLNNFTPFATTLFASPVDLHVSTKSLPTPALSVDKNFGKYRKGITLLRQEKYHEALSVMEGIDPAHFEAVDVFYYYRAEISFLASTTLNSLPSVRGELRKAYADISLASAYNSFPSSSQFTKKIIELKKKIVKDLILRSYQDRDWRTVISLTEKFDEMHGVSGDKLPMENILMYIVSLVKLKNNLVYHGIVKNYYRQLSDLSIDDWKTLQVPVVVDEESKKTIFTIMLEIKKQIIEKEKTQEKEKGKDINISAKIKNESDFSHLELEELLEKLEKHFYVKGASAVAGTLRSRYLSLLSKELNQLNLSKTEASFIEEFEDYFEDLHPEITSLLIVPMWKMGLFEKCDKLIKTIIKKYPAYGEVPRFLFYRARIAQDQKKYDEAIKFFSKAYELTLNHEESEDALYQIGWSAMMKGAYEKAISSFDKYLEHYPNGAFAVNARYFTIKALEKREGGEVDEVDGNKEGGKKIIAHKVKELIEKHPLDFYTLLYLNESGQEWDYQKIFGLTTTETTHWKEIEKEIKRSIKWQRIFKKYEELKKLELYEEGAELLGMIDFDASNIEGMLVLAKELGLIQSVDKSTIIYMKIIRSGMDSVHRNKVKLQDVFPAFWKNEIVTTLKKLNLSYPPYLIMSLMRQESVFNPNALSAANAKGLMQVIDATALGAAKGLDLKEYDILNPEHNILIGVKVLSDELNKFDNKVYLALAAYNAGPESVKRWLRWRGEMDPISFIESIPYKETNGYVKAILRNYFIYQMFYEKKKLKELRPLYSL